MKKVKQVNRALRIPAPMMVELRDLARKRGEPVSVIIREALRAYLPIPERIARRAGRYPR